MKVVHVFNDLKFSGAEIMYVDAASIFQENNCELYVLSTASKAGEYAPYFKNAGYTVLHMPYPKKKNLIKRIKYAIQLLKFIKDEKIDVIHSHSSCMFWNMALIAKLAKIHSVYTFHNVFKTKKITHPYYYLLRWSAKHLFNCRFQTISDSVYNNELNRFKNKTTKIYNWYGNTRFFPASPEEKLKTRKSLGLPEKALVLISVGGCSSVKRHSEILKSLPIILQHIPKCIYLHLGTGEIEDEERKLAKALKLGAHVRFLGNQSDVRKYLISSDIYLMPSRFEGMPITTIEALGCKVPAILYDVPGLRDFNFQGNNCIIISEDYTILAKEVLALNANPSLKSELTKNSFDFVNTHFSMDINALKIIELYKFRK